MLISWVSFSWVNKQDPTPKPVFNYRLSRSELFFIPFAIFVGISILTNEKKVYQTGKLAGIIKITYGMGCSV